MFTYKRENPGEGDNYFVDVYRFIMDVKDEDLHLQEAETDGYMFATLDEIKPLRQRINSFIMTVSNRHLNSDKAVVSNMAKCDKNKCNLFDIF